MSVAQEQRNKHEYPADEFLSNFAFNDPEMDDVIRLSNASEDILGKDSF